MGKRYYFKTIEGYITANPKNIIKHEEITTGYGDNEKEAKKSIIERYKQNNVTLTKLKRIRGKN